MPSVNSKTGKSGDVAERSPAVFSANLKEDILLEKQVHVLNRSERSVVHRIKVEQKVMYRQFQSRLVRSKLAMARLMGNKALEKELRSKNFGGLHTDIVAEEDYGFLTKLEHRPCTAKHYTPPHREISRERENTIMPMPVKNKDQLQSKKLESAAPISLPRASTTVGSMTAPSQHQSERSHRENAFNYRQLSEIDAPARTNTKMLKMYSESSKAQNGLRNEDKKEKSANNLRPKTVTIVVHSPDTTPLPSPRQYSRRTSKAADFFEEDQKIDLVELRLKAARSLDYTDRVQHFCDKLEDMASGQPLVDWYSMRLHASVEKDPNQSMSGDEGDRKAMGNVNVRSLTLPHLDLNFKNS